MKTVLSPKRWTPSKGWHDNPRFSVRFKLWRLLVEHLNTLLLLSGAAVATKAMIEGAEEDKGLREVIDVAEDIRRRERKLEDPTEIAVKKLEWVTGPLKRYLAQFVSGERALGIALVAAAGKIIRGMFPTTGD